MGFITRITAFLILTIAIITLLVYAGMRLKWSKLFSPAPLSSVHAELDKNGECEACHTPGKGLDNSKYLDCHQKISSMIEKKAGLHSRVTTECALCHSEHHGRSHNLIHFNPQSFDHSLTGWPISGKHTLLNCEACHTKGSYLLDKNKCFNCHQDIHEGENGQECSDCHNQNTFKEVD